MGLSAEAAQNIALRLGAWSATKREKRTRTIGAASTLIHGEQVVDISRNHAQRRFWGKLMSLPLRFLYWIYERRLLHQIGQRPMPSYIGIILDGNRRHARQRGLHDPRTIYQRGAEKLDDILDWCAELSIPAVTLWVFSTENFKRSPTEISGILAAIEAKVGTLAHNPLLHQKRVRVRAIGRLDVLPSRLLPHFTPRKQQPRNTI